jgi:membrane protein implicated in regulation of membrane protease activity
VKGQGLVARIGAAILSLALIILGLLFSFVLFAAALAAGAALLVWFWWKSRQFRRQMRDAAAHGTGGAGPAGEVIEGEIIHTEWREDSRRD